ncbi:MAG TPA: DUF2934 domain-containing protein [Alphaproteobacteria bacterium]
MPPPDDDRIRRRAYEIWEREGRPLGRHDEHWRMAEEELAGEERRLETQTVPATRVAKPAVEGAPREQAPAEVRPEAATEAPHPAAPAHPSPDEAVPPIAPQAEPLGLTGQKAAQEAIAKDESQAGPKRRRSTKSRSRAKKRSDTPETPGS